MQIFSWVVSLAEILGVVILLVPPAYKTMSPLTGLITIYLIAELGVVFLAIYVMANDPTDSVAKAHAEAVKINQSFDV
jgi:hypothetical protein